MKLDGANGVGADKMRRLMNCFAAGGGEQVLTVDVLNDGSSGVLNHQVRGGLYCRPAKCDLYVC